MLSVCRSVMLIVALPVSGATMDYFTLLYLLFSVGRAHFPANSIERNANLLFAFVPHCLFFKLATREEKRRKKKQESTKIKSNNTRHDRFPIRRIQLLRLLIVFVIQFKQKCERNRVQKKNWLGFLFAEDELSHFTCSYRDDVSECVGHWHNMLIVCFVLSASPCKCSNPSDSYALALHIHSHKMPKQPNEQQKENQCRQRAFQLSWHLNKNESNELESDLFKWNYMYLYEFQKRLQNMNFWCHSMAIT